MNYEDFKARFESNIDFVTFRGWTSSIKDFIKRSGLKIDNDISTAQDIPGVLRIIDSVDRGSKLYYEYLIQNNSEPNCCVK